jgi:ketosteroid isomerase-like protein
VPENFEEFQCMVVEARDEGERVVVQARFTGRSKSGKEMDVAAEQEWEIRDGKIARMKNKPSDQQAWAEGWS